MQRMIAVICVTLCWLAGMSSAWAQVKNGMLQVQTVGYQFKSNANGDGYGFSLIPWDDDDNDVEENVCQVWLSNAANSTTPYCHVWRRANYSENESHRSQSDYPNISIGTFPATYDSVIDVHATYWENDMGLDCIFDYGSTFIMDYDDFYTANVHVGNYVFATKPQSEWYFHPLTSFALTNSNQTPSSNSTWIGVKTYWNYTHGNDINDALDFGEVKHTTPMLSHINKNSTTDPEGHLAPNIAYTSQAHDPSPDVYYKFKLTERSTVELSTMYPETNYDSRLWLYELGSGQLITSNDDYNSSQKSFISQELCAGDYYVIVEGYNQAAGQFKLSLDALPVYTYTDSTWVVTTFNGTQLNLEDAYETGHFVVNKTAINSSEFYDGTSDYNTIPGFQFDNCKSTSGDNFIHVYKTRLTGGSGLCGRMYGLVINEVDDHAAVYLDGEAVWLSDTANCTNGCGLVWSGSEQEFAGAILEVRHQEVYGNAKIDFSGGVGIDGGWRIEFFDDYALDYGSNTGWQHLPGYMTYLGDAVPYVRKPSDHETHIYHMQGGFYVENPHDFIKCPPYHIFNDNPVSFIYKKQGFEPGFYTFQARAHDIRYPTLYINGQIQDGYSTVNTNIRYSPHFNAPYPISIPVSTRSYSYWSHQHYIGNSSPVFLDEDDLVEFLGEASFHFYEHGLTIHTTETPSLLSIHTNSNAQAPCDPAPSTVLTGTLGGFSDSKVSYQWQQSNDGGTTWVNVNGATSLTYTPTYLNQPTQFRLSLVHSSGKKVAHSNTVTINITPTLLQGGSTNGSQQMVGCQSLGTLTVIGASESLFTTYQWQTSTDGMTYTDLTGAHSATLTPAPTSQNTYYRRVNYLHCGDTVHSDPIFVQVTAPNPTPLTGGQVPAYNELTPCTQTALSVSGLSGAQSGLTYQWQASTDSVNWSNISNANASILNATYLSYDQYYRCVVTNVCGESTTTSPGLVKSINDNPPTSNGWNIGVRQSGQFLAKGQDPSLSINNLDGNSLAIVPNYTGCPAPIDNYQVIYRRTGWPCDSYRFQLANFAANPNSTLHLRIDENGDGNWEHTTTHTVGFDFNYVGPGPFLYLTLSPAPFDLTASLNLNSIVEIEVNEPITDPYFPNNGLIFSKSLNVQVTPQGSTAPNLLAGTAAGDQALYNCSSPSTITVTGTTGSAPYTYQWQASTDGGNNWNNIAGATAADYTPAPLAQSTAFRRMTADVCGNTAYTNAVVKTINALPAEGGAGNGLWNAYAYTGQNFDTYTGRFTLPHLSFNLTNDAMNADVNGNPSVAPTYAGCDLPNDYWSTRLLCTGWACGTYRFNFTDWDDNLTFKVDRDGDGTFEFNQSLNCCATNTTMWWNVDLNPNSVVAIEYQEAAGAAFLNLTVTTLGNGLVAGTASGDETADRCAPLSAITVTGEAASSAVTYQWQASTDGGNNWSNIAGATAADYTPAPLSQTTAFRRMTADVCGNTAPTNAVVKTINPLPVEGIAGNGLWNAYAYTGQNFDTYTGRFTLSHPSFNLTNDAMNADVNGNPSVAADYIGCPLPNDYWSLRLLRTGWACGTYRFDFIAWDDNLTLKVDRDGDGTFEFSQSLNCCASGTSTFWDLGLNPNSIVAIDFQEAAGAAFLNLNVTTLGNGLLAGTASGDETADPCASLTPLTVTGEAASSAVTYQWQASTDGGNNWSDLTGATAATYTPQSLNVTTAFRRKATDVCGNVAATNAVTKTINGPIAVGSNVWHVNAYSGANFDAFMGHFTLSSVGFNLTNDAMNADVNGNPSAAPTYVGCPLPNDAWSLRLARTGWACGTYRFDFTDWNDHFTFKVDGDGDGTFEFNQSVSCCATHTAMGWNVDLNPNSVVAIDFQEVAGPAFLNLTVTDLGSGLNPGTASGDETADACESLAAITGTASAGNAVTYQWQASTDSGNNWSDIAGATATDYAPQPLNVTTAFRRKATDACGNTAFSNVVTKTIVPFAPQSIAGTASGDETADACESLAAITVTASAGNAVTYQWQASTDGGNNWSDIAGATAADYAPQPLNITTAFRRKATDACGNTAFSNVVTKTIVPFAPQSIAGTASGDETADACESLAAITVTGTTPSSTVYYQWQASTNGGSSWYDIAGATAANYSPQHLLATTAFRRKATDACGNTAFSNVVTKTIIPLPTESTPGDGVWYGYGYDGSDTYLGFYTLPGLNIDLAQAMGSPLASPSSIAGYQGCALPVDGFTTALYRTGWHCGTYRFHFTFWTGMVILLVDEQGDGTYETAHAVAPNQYTAGGTFWDVNLTPSSVIGIAFIDVGGNAIFNLSVTPPANGLVAGTASGTETADACAPLSAISVTGDAADRPVTYQWQASTDGGSTWSDLPGATAAIYTPQALNVTTAFRRKATDGCSRVFTNAVTKTISPLPTEGVAGESLWAGYAYDGEWSSYRGRFTASGTDLQLSSIGLSANDANAQPADIGTYIGCATDAEAFSVRLLRRDWPAAHYTFALADIDGNAQIAIDTDGNGTWEYLSPSLDAPASNLWAGVLDSNAIVRIEYKDQAGVSRLQVTASSAALPVELIHFEASIDEDRKTRLHWATATELNNEGFEIERSTDGLTWEVIGWMPGQGTTQERTDYFHWDEAPHDGLNYYRLHQRDYDGSGAHSPIRTVQYDHSPKGQKPIAFPNPVTNGTLTLLHAQGRVTLSSSLGQALQTWRIDADEARIDLSRYAQGAYWLTVVAPDGQVTTLRIIK